MQTEREETSLRIATQSLLKPQEPSSPSSAETSEVVLKRISNAIAIQKERFEKSVLSSNSDMGPVEVWDHC